MNNETSYFLFQIISFKKYFLLFLWSPPPSYGGPRQLPSLPSLKSGRYIIITINFKKPSPSVVAPKCVRTKTAASKRPRAKTVAPTWLRQNVPFRVGNSVLGYNKTEANLQRTFNSYVKTAS